MNIARSLSHSLFKTSSRFVNNVKTLYSSKKLFSVHSKMSNFSYILNLSIIEDKLISWISLRSQLNKLWKKQPKILLFPRAENMKLINNIGYCLQLQDHCHRLKRVSTSFENDRHFLIRKEIEATYFCAVFELQTVPNYFFFQFFSKH